ncbi:MAG: hypothetical protein AAF721_10705, partial [Myxococcota bacterium]
LGEHGSAHYGADVAFAVLGKAKAPDLEASEAAACDRKKWRLHDVAVSPAGDLLVLFDCDARWVSHYQPDNREGVHTKLLDNSGGGMVALDDTGAGYILADGGKFHLFRWQDGKPTPLPEPPRKGYEVGAMGLDAKGELWYAAKNQLAHGPGAQWVTETPGGDDTIAQLQFAGGKTWVIAGTTLYARGDDGRWQSVGLPTPDGPATPRALIEAGTEDVFVAGLRGEAATLHTTRTVTTPFRCAELPKPQ